MLSQEGVGVKAAVGLLNWCQNGMAPPDQMRLFEMNICSYIEPSNRIPDYSRRNRLVNHFESQQPRLCTCYSPPSPTTPADETANEFCFIHKRNPIQKYVHIYICYPVPYRTVSQGEFALRSRCGITDGPSLPGQRRRTYRFEYDTTR